MERRPRGRSGRGSARDPRSDRRPGQERPGLFDAPVESGAGAAADSPVWSVGALTREIAGRVADIGRVRVEGEVSGLKRAASGHLYFDLKDASARLSCAIWRSQVERALRAELEEGMQVVARGKLDVYAPRGSYSLIVERVEPLGLGALLARLEELKAELRALGWFDRARPLPALPRTVGVVTSRDGAALRDFLRTRSLRWPLYPVRLRHTPVQGPGAAPEIAAAIRALDASGVDLIVVTRGGGSLEDLWAFNERVVAEAIHGASVPVVSGVGHESDVTLADLVADVRAHTPTDAAQTVIPDRAALLERLRRAGAWLATAVDGLVEERADRLARLGGSRVLRDASWILADRGRELERALGRLRLAQRRALDRAGELLRAAHRGLERHGPAARVERAGARLALAARGLDAEARRALERSGARLAVSAASLEAISPLAVLGRGYSVTTRAEGGAALRDAARLAAGDELRTRLASGAVRSRVLEVEREADRGDASP